MPALSLNKIIIGKRLNRSWYFGLKYMLVIYRFFKSVGTYMHACINTIGPKMNTNISRQFFSLDFQHWYTCCKRFFSKFVNILHRGMKELKGYVFLQIIRWVPWHSGHQNCLRKQDRGLESSASLPAHIWNLTTNWNRCVVGTKRYMCRVARFFLVHVTKTGKMYQINTKCTKW
jgi:hypothetical protein